MSTHTTIEKTRIQGMLSIETIHSSQASDRCEVVIIDTCGTTPREFEELCGLIRAKTSSKQTRAIVLVRSPLNSQQIMTLYWLGAHICVNEECSDAELDARFRSLVRRHHRHSPQAALTKSDYLRCGPIALSKSRHLATVDGSTLRLTLREFLILELLMRHAGTFLTRKDIWSALDGDATGARRVIDVHISRLKSKLGEASRMIFSERGKGYGIAATAVSVSSPDLPVRNPPRLSSNNQCR